VKAHPVGWREAKAWVDMIHRHHLSPQGWKFGIAAMDDDRMVGVAMVGKPTARMIASTEPLTCEVRRLATDGTRNACSFLYARSREAAKAMGYTRVITYILNSEPGTSLKAAGFRFVRLAGGGKWDRPSRRREDNAPTEIKQLWEWRAA
jgi:hypothetical protein